MLRSLVGSEMCIRDSVYTEPMTNWMSMPKEAPRTYEGAVALMEERATGAVSYTHLTLPTIYSV